MTSLLSRLLFSTALLLSVAQTSMAREGTEHDWSGTWQSSFGELRLVDQGRFVVGDYAEHGVIVARKSIVGECGAIALSGTFTNGARAGTLNVVRLPGGEFEGRWRFAGDDGEGRWRGSRTRADAPALSNFSANGVAIDVAGPLFDIGLPAWMIGANRSDFGDVTLAGTLRAVVGDYAGRGVVAGLWDGTAVRGRFTNGPRSGFFTWRPDGAESWAGDWRWADASPANLARWNGRPTSSTGTDPLAALGTERLEAEWIESLPGIERCSPAGELETHSKNDLLADSRVAAASPLALTAPDSIGTLTTASYARQCAAAIGSSVPDFDCVADGVEIPIERYGQAVGSTPDDCDNPAQLGDTRPCSIRTYLGRIDADSHPATVTDPDAETVFVCRKYTELDDSDLFQDIAVIHHNRRSGATCWYQSPTSPSLRMRKEVPSPEAAIGSRPAGAPAAAPGEEFVRWLSPSATESINCYRCHSADPYIRTPYVNEVAENGRPVLPSRPRGPYWNYAFHDWDTDNDATVPNANAPGNAGGCIGCHRLSTTHPAFASNATGQTSNRGSWRPDAAWMHVGGTRPYTHASPSAATGAALGAYRSATGEKRAISPLLSGSWDATITTDGERGRFGACVTFDRDVPSGEARADIRFDDGRPGTLSGSFGNPSSSHLAFDYQHASDSGTGELVVRHGRARADGEWLSSDWNKRGGWTLVKRRGACPG